MDEENATPETEQAEAVQQPAALDNSHVAKELDSLRAELEKVNSKNRELLEEKAEARKKAEAAALEAARKSGDIESLEKSWGDKLTKREQELRAELEERDRMIQRLTVDSTASRLAGELALPGHADVLRPHIERRLAMEIRNGMPQVRVLSIDGKASALTIDDLKKEFLSNGAFAPILSGTKANGAGRIASGSGESGKKFGDYSGDELVALRRANLDEYNRIRDAHYAEQAKARRN
jgi:hypothetical protein